MSALGGGHPVPDASSVHAAEELQRFVAAVPAEALLIALVSGGASAMVAKPRDGVTLAAKIAATSRRMAEGASIAELNALRRSLSAVKGGQLVAGAAAPVLSLIVSDVAGDDPRIIASGLTVTASAQLLAESARSEASEASEASSPRAADRFAILAGQDAVARAAAEQLTARGWDVERISAPLVGEVVEVADQLLAALRRHGPPRLSQSAPASALMPALAPRKRAVVAHGEPVVRLPEDAGTGGRAQQLALLLAQRLAGIEGVAALIAGTDGVDGPSLPPAAGGLVDGGTWAALTAAGADGVAALARCDARPALEAAGALLVTGATGLNHADVMILLEA